MVVVHKSTKGKKKVTRYTYDDIQEPRAPETGHTSLLPGEEQVVSLPMDNGWSRAIDVRTTFSYLKPKKAYGEAGIDIGGGIAAAASCRPSF
jgi:hypothetical protein